MTIQQIINIILSLGLFTVSMGNIILQKQINRLNHCIMMLVKLYDHKCYVAERGENDNNRADCN